ncbi:MAG: type II toxin-antitoxin system Phd/YefM family antitoxin [Fimbriimonadaceae bacterium]
MIRATDIHSLTDFTRNAKTYIKKIKDSKCPIALTVNGDAEVVVQDAAAYQEMVDELEHSRFIAAMREGIQDVEAGRTRPAHVVFAELKAKYEI